MRFALHSLLFLLIVAQQVVAQPAKPAPFNQPHIKVLLLGTFHFGSTGDKNSTGFPHLFTPKRQSEIDQLTRRLAALRPNKVFVENVPENQIYWDSITTAYRRHKADTGNLRNEIFQLGIRTALRAGLPGIICVDHQQALPYDKIEAFANRTGTDTALSRRMDAYRLLAFNYPYPKDTFSRKHHTLAEYLVHLQTPEYDAANRADYFVYAPNYGYGSDYTGVEMITSWYDRNAKIFTNILRKTDPEDHLIIVIYGAAHMLPLRHYFAMHPYFTEILLAEALRMPVGKM